MKKIFVYGLTGLAFAIACTAQTNSQPSKSVSSVDAGSQPGTQVSTPSSSAPTAVDDTIRGFGTAGTVPLFTAPRTLGNSVIVQNSSGAIGIGGAAVGAEKLGVAGNLRASGSISGAQYNIGSERALATPGNNAFVGVGAGSYNSGSGNALFGYFAGAGGNAGSNNAAFGIGSGYHNNGANNAFFGSYTGESNLAGAGNAYFGSNAGRSGNGSENAFFGHGAGENFSGGSNNTLLGAGTAATVGVFNATAIGSGAFATKSNTLILGGVSGVNGGSNVNVGIGVTEPTTKLDVAGDVFISKSGSALIMRTTGGFSCARLVINDQAQISVTILPSCPGEF